MKPARKRDSYRFRKVARVAYFPRAMLIDKGAQPAPGVEKTRISLAHPFVADGFNFPRSEDVFFDAVVRVPTLALNATSTQTVFTTDQITKGGWIRRVGYGFNNPHGYFQVRTTILINGAPPPRYIYKTIDAQAAGTPYQGSLPTVQIGTLQNPSETFIYLPSSALVEVRFVNSSTTESFACALRLWGWLFP